MAEQAEEPKKSLIDGAFLNEFITLYLYGFYVAKKGRFTPPEAMEKVMQMSRMMEKAAGMGKLLQKRLAGFARKQEG